MPSSTVLCYLFPVSEDGKDIISVQEEAQFYLGCYLFVPDEHHAFVEIYADLQKKLFDIYGVGNETQTSSLTTTTWIDSIGNSIFLRINDEGTYVSLAYYAAGADNKLIEVKGIVTRKEEERKQEEIAKKADEEAKTIALNESVDGL